MARLVTPTGGGSGRRRLVAGAAALGLVTVAVVATVAAHALGTRPAAAPDGAAIRQSVTTYLAALASPDPAKLKAAVGGTASTDPNLIATRLAQYGGVQPSQVRVEYLDQAVPDVMVVKITRPPSYNPNPETIMVVRDRVQQWRISLDGLGPSPTPAATPASPAASPDASPLDA